MKNEEREKQLSAYTKSLPKRPASAKAAQQAVAGEIKGESATGATKTELSADDQKKIAMRKALAERLKKEVIYK